MKISEVVMRKRLAIFRFNLIMKNTLSSSYGSAMSAEMHLDLNTG